MVEFYLGWFSVLGMDPEPYAHPASTLSLSYMPSPPCLNCRDWYQVSILIWFTSLLGWETIRGVISTLYGQTQFPSQDWLLRHRDMSGPSLSWRSQRAYKRDSLRSHERAGRGRRAGELQAGFMSVYSAGGSVWKHLWTRDLWMGILMLS